MIPTYSTKISEAMIEEAILQYLNCVGWFAWKNPTTGYYDSKIKGFRKQSSSYSINGVSDIIAVRDGEVLFIEVKTKKGVQSKYQKIFEQKIKESGGIYWVVRSVQDVKLMLEGLEHEKINASEQKTSVEKNF